MFVVRASLVFILLGFLFFTLSSPIESCAASRGNCEENFIMNAEGRLERLSDFARRQTQPDATPGPQPSTGNIAQRLRQNQTADRISGGKQQPVVGRLTRSEVGDPIVARGEARRAGDIVATRRTDGSITNARVIDVSDEGISVIPEGIDGPEEAIKILQPEEVLRRVDSPTNGVRVGTKVVTPLPKESGSGFLEGRVVGFENGQVIVDVVDEVEGRIRRGYVGASFDELRYPSSRVRSGRARVVGDANELAGVRSSRARAAQADSPAPSRSPSPAPSTERAETVIEASPRVQASRKLPSVEDTRRAQQEYREYMARETKISIYTGSEKSYWRQWTGTNPNETPIQGWKLHVSAKVENAVDVAQALLPELRRYGIPHKVIGDINAYTETLQRGGTQVGKFITVYPRTEAAAKRYARLLRRLLREKGMQREDFIPVPGEADAGTGVFGRYGRLKGGDYVDPESGQRVVDGALIGPDGRLYPDSRGQAAPEFIDDDVFAVTTFSRGRKRSPNKE